MGPEQKGFLGISAQLRGEAVVEVLGVHGSVLVFDVGSLC